MCVTTYRVKDATCGKKQLKEMVDPRIWAALITVKNNVVLSKNYRTVTVFSLKNLGQGFFWVGRALSRDFTWSYDHHEIPWSSPASPQRSPASPRKTTSNLPLPLQVQTKFPSLSGLHQTPPIICTDSSKVGTIINKYAIHAYTHGPVTGSGPLV